MVKRNVNYPWSLTVMYSYNLKVFRLAPSRLFMLLYERRSRDSAPLNSEKNGLLRKSRKYFTVKFLMSSASPGQMYLSLAVLRFWVLIAGGWTENDLSFSCPPLSSLLPILFPGLPWFKTITSPPTPPPLLNTHKDMGVISLLRSRFSGCHATLPRSVAWHPERRLRRRLGSYWLLSRSVPFFPLAVLSLV